MRWPRKLWIRLTILAQQNFADRPWPGEGQVTTLLNRVVRFYEEFIKTNKDESLTQEKGERVSPARQYPAVARQERPDAAASYRTACDNYLLVLQRAPKDENDEPSRALAETSINLWVVLTDLGKEGRRGCALDRAAHQELIGLHAAFLVTRPAVPSRPGYVRKQLWSPGDIKAGKGT